MERGKASFRETNLVHSIIRLLTCVSVGMVLFSLIPARAFPSNFSVTPTSIDLNAGVKSGALTVVNSGDEKLNCQIDVREWSQDSEGKDVYTDTKDVVFFPKIMTVAPNEQRAIRIGFKGPQNVKEKTYRLFIEEIPSQKKGPEAKEAGKISAGLTIAFRYAVPIFMKPAKPQESAIVEKVDMAKGVAEAVIKNTGNVHAKLLTITFRGKAADGKELFSKDVAGWYVLQGLSRRYTATVPKEVCNNIATIEVNAQAENFTVSGTLNVQRKMCAQ